MIAKRLYPRFLLTLGALVASFAALAPTASAAIEFEPGVYAKAHPPLTQTPPSPISCIPFQCSFSFSGYESWLAQTDAAPELTEAGGRPDFTTHFRFVNFVGADNPRTILTDAPAGAVGNPLAVPPCEAAEFNLTLTGNCPKESQVGTSITVVGGNFFLSPVSSLVPYPGAPALLGFKNVNITVILVPEVRSDGDYGLRVNADHIPRPIIDYIGSTITLWGVPGDPIHNSHRVNDVGALGGAVAGTPVPFLSAPTNCSTGPIDLTLSARSWQDPDAWAQATSTAPEPIDCEDIEFDPAVTAQPTTNFADQPSGLEVDVHTPQNNRCVDVNPGLGVEWDCGLATSHLKDTTLTLPEGLVINPSGANGLDGCSTEEIGLSTPLGVSPQQFTKDQPACPDASKIGTVEVDTPLLDAPMPGAVYIADPYDNPFRSLTAIYIVANDTERGIIAKLAGKVDRDPATGQLTTTVTDAPQLPFEHFYLHIKQGPHAPLRTPGCGEHTTNAQLTPYSDPGSPVPTSDGFSITQGSCDNPNAPAFDAGTVSPIAKAFSPFVVHLRREDGSQNFSTVTVREAEGLTAKLAGTPACPDGALAAAAQKSGAGEKADPSCPAASRVGTVVIGAGAGASPYYASGEVYLAGPYKGAPASLAAIVPATAGPFDLGTVVNRTAAYIDPKSAQITGITDPIPSILDGIPTDVKTIDLILDKPEFSLTGTSCDPSSIDGQVTSLLGQVAELSSRFQLAECTSLGFKPKMAIRLKGGTARGKHPQLTAILMPRPGDANIAGVSVAFPKSEFLENAHIRTICTRPAFAADQCPRGAIYGTSTVTSPLLDYPLTGNVYLRSSNNLLPDVVPDLRGPAHQPIRVEAAGRTDSIRGGIRNTFDFFPDAPFTRAVLRMQGGNKGLLVNSRNICARTYRARVVFTAHNGKRHTIRPKLVAQCKKKRKGKRRGHKRNRAVAHRSAVR